MAQTSNTMRCILTCLFVLQGLLLVAQLPGERLDPGMHSGRAMAMTRPAMLRGSDPDPELIARLQDTLNKYRVDAGAVGLSGALIFPDGQVWTGASGVNASPAQPMLTSQALGMGSITKTITAAAIFRLVDQGKLSLDDALQQHIVSYPNVNGGITIRQCLRHESGLFDYTEDEVLGNAIISNSEKIWTPDEILNQFVGPPLSAPGTTFYYCNTNYLLLGKVIEAASGMSYHSFVRQELLEPLGLDNLTLGTIEEATDPRAHPWINPGFGKLDVILAGLSLNGAFSSAWAAGAYWGRPADVAQWIRALVTGEVLTPASLTAMQDVLMITPELAYGHGLIRYRINGIDAWGHGGNIIFKSVALHVPTLGATVCVMSNDNDFIDEGPTVQALLQGWQDYLATGLEQAQWLSEVQIWPNPAGAECRVSGLPEGAMVRLLSSEGKEMGAALVGSGGEARMLAELVPSWRMTTGGMYWLQVTWQGAQRTWPLLRQD